MPKKCLQIKNKTKNNYLLSLFLCLFYKQTGNNDNFLFVGSIRLSRILGDVGQHNYHEFKVDN